MLRFSEFIKESNTENFVLTNSEFYKYKKFINKLLKSTYPERAVNISENTEEVNIYKAFKYEKDEIPGREYSVLGKVNTNKLLISRIWEKFKINDYRHLENLVRKLKFDLFDEEGKFFKSNSGTFSVWDTIRYTEMIGEKNEDEVCKFIKEWYGNESNPIREVTSSYKDMILGIDITFKIGGRDRTCQVKPLKSSDFRERGFITVESSGVIKKYNTDFIAFINSSRCLFFVNRGGTYYEQTMRLPYQNLVHNGYIKKSS